MNRSDILSALQKDAPDVIIIGAGLLGASVFRDLAHNGVNVLLVDRGDFCSGPGASFPWVSRDGLQALLSGSLRVARDAVTERNLLVENAAHVVKPLLIVRPVFKISSGIWQVLSSYLRPQRYGGEKGALILKWALFALDRFTASRRIVPEHRLLGSEKALKKFPRFSPAIRYAAIRYDVCVTPGRLVMDLVLDAEAAGSHAKALNYFSLEQYDSDQLIFRDEVTGRQVGLRAGMLINAAGSFTGDVNSRMGLQGGDEKTARGVYMVLDHPGLLAAIADNAYDFDTAEGCAVSILPYSGKVLVVMDGLPVTAGENVAQCSLPDFEYLIGVLSRIFPTIQLRPEHLITSFAASSQDYSPALRGIFQQVGEDWVRDRVGELDVFSFPVGSRIAFRAAGERVTNQVLHSLGIARNVDTRRLPVGGGRNYPDIGLARIEYISQVAAETGLSNLQPRKLFERYGTRAMEIASFIASRKGIPLASLPDWLRAEVVYLVEHEKALYIDDVLLRRTSLIWQGNVSNALVLELAEILAEVLELDAQAKDSQLLRAEKILRDEYGTRLA